MRNKKMELRTPALGRGSSLPPCHTPRGEDYSPPLAWTRGPRGTACYALVMEAPDAPTGPRTQWVAWNVPGTELPEGLEADSVLEDGTRQGVNSRGWAGYSGPVPEEDGSRFVIRVWALEQPVQLPPTAGREALLTAIARHILASGALEGTLPRSA